MEFPDALTREQIDSLVDRYPMTGLLTVEDWIDKGAGGSQYDDRSSAINYALVRHYQPRKIVEFGTRTGRCTYVILKALFENENDFTYNPYEIDKELRKLTQKNIDETVSKNIVRVGGDVTKAKNIPDGIDYLFVDNSHDMDTTVWLFETLLPKCKDGALVQIHDIPLKDNFQVGKEGFFPETSLIVGLHKEGYLPLEKLYWTFEEEEGMESSFWIYKPL